MPRRLNYNIGFPSIVSRKLYKTGQTRGAERDQIYQNRVSRNSKVLIPLQAWIEYPQLKHIKYENGYIVFARPVEYFSASPPSPKSEIPDDLILGQNFLLFYRTREEWNRFNPERFGWPYARSRNSPLQGQFIARVPDTTRTDDTQIFLAYTGNDSGGVGAGIRVYEYANSENLRDTRYQAAYLVWRTEGIFDLVKKHGEDEPELCKEHVDRFCIVNGLADEARLERSRLMKDGKTICPLCLNTISADDLALRVPQALGRETIDLTVTSANLFHVDELRIGEFNHCPYNLGFGHHHCNIVVRDYGIKKTLNWMISVLENNSYIVKK